MGLHQFFAVIKKGMYISGNSDTKKKNSEKEFENLYQKSYLLGNPPFCHCVGLQGPLTGLWTHGAYIRYWQYICAIQIYIDNAKVD